MKPHARLWLLFASGALIVMIALGWVTARVLDLENREARARGDAQYQESLRLSLWRMDSWFAPRLAREAARPYFEYLPYYPQARAYTRILNEISKGEVLTPSPLLTFASDYFPIHFQVNADGTVTSPQVPTESQRDLAESTLLTGGQIEAHEAMLRQIAPLLSRDMLVQRVIPAEERITAMTCDINNTPAVTVVTPQTGQVANIDAGQQRGSPRQGKSQTMMTQEEQAQRWANANLAQQAEAPQQQQQRGVSNEDLKQAMSKTQKSGAILKDEAAEVEPQVTIGPLVPLWIGQASSAADQQSSRNLIFVRRVTVGERECFQGFLGDWPRIHHDLHDQITGLLDNASLEPLEVSPTIEQSTGRELTTVPAKLVTASIAPPAMDMLSPARVTLGITWLAVLGAIFAAGLTLRASIHYGEKRSRFASAVTHELRTPLTTFRMYSEMLAEGMVTDEAQRKLYLETLKSESARLATLVENVLSYARLEEGRFASHTQKTTLKDMFARLTPILDRRAKDAGMELKVRLEPSPSAPGQGQGEGMATETLRNPDARSMTPALTPALSQGEREIRIDTEAVGQILFNLVDNACKYANGTTDRTIQIDAAQNEGRIVINVRDHGPGVPPEHSRVIFAPFERGAHRAGNTIPGVGLGLALSRGLARDMGGELTLNGADSRTASKHPYGGAWFVLSLPITQPPRA